MDSNAMTSSMHSFNRGYGGNASNNYGGPTDRFLEMFQRQLETTERERLLKIGVRYYNYEGFMNRIPSDNGDFTIEVFVATRPWERDVSDEIARQKRLEYLERAQSIIDVADLTSGSQVHMEPESFGDNYRLQRVRIRSQVVLDALFEASGDGNALRSRFPQQFCRPFRLFHDTFEDIKKKLETMEADRIVSSTEEPAESLACLFNTQDASPGENPDSLLKPGPSEEVQRRRSAELRDLRCFVEFVQSKIIPLWLQFRSPELLPRRVVTYEEIPCLAKPGDLVYLQSKSRPTNAGLVLDQCEVWRLAACRPIEPYGLFIEDEKRRYNAGQPPFPHMTKTTWVIYRVDYDGDEFLTSHEEVTFDMFRGEQEITSLRCFPLSFHPYRDSTLSRAATNGRLFKSHIYKNPNVVHLYYSGMALFPKVDPRPALPRPGPKITYIDNPEHIESEIVVDSKEALRSHPYLVQRRGTVELYNSNWWKDRDPEAPSRLWAVQKTAQTDTSIQYAVKWTSVVRRENLPPPDERLYKKDSEDFSKKDTLMQARDKSIVVASHDWVPEDLALLPQYLFAYVLRERKFAVVRTEGIDWDSRQSKITLDDIEIKSSYRHLIRAAVSSHLNVRDRERQGMPTMNLDIIRGKGKGLVILLHGSPGVGKTATAEAVAIEYKKPLFSITCEDLGTSSATMEESFRSICRYAHLWDCILLLDEADIFFTQRQRGHNTEKDALVGVFLRVLEYYSGILFLTTNRVGAMDEAFSSRMHLSLWYKHLSLEYTIQILQNNLGRLPKYDKNKQTTDGVLNVRQDEIEKFIREEYLRYSKIKKKERGPWNGRQIRNAVQIASSLALYEKECKEEDDGLPATLTADHFRSVASTMFEFEDFLKQARVGDDTFHAKQRQERHDDFQSQDHDQEDEDEGSTYSSFREPSGVSYRDNIPRIEFDNGSDNQEYGGDRRHARERSREWTNDQYPRNSRR